MIMIRDGTGRFPERPHWELRELEQLCGETITKFLIKRYGFERISVPTEALTELIECHAAPLEIGRNLSDNQYEVLGYTQFEPGEKPCVKIALDLWQKWYQANRLRFTLACHLEFQTSGGGGAITRRGQWQDSLFERTIPESDFA